MTYIPDGRDSPGLVPGPNTSEPLAETILILGLSFRLTKNDSGFWSAADPRAATADSRTYQATDW